MEKVSVIVPCYKQAQFLGEALQSILDQSYTNWECIIVNDGSPDHTEIVAKEWLTKDLRFKYVYKKNGGLSSARNFGIRESVGEYILTLDADDKYEKTFIEKALNFLKKNSKVGVVSSWILRFKDDKELAIIKPNGKTVGDFLFQNAANGTSLFRKKCWEAAGGYDEEMKKGYEDWDFYIRVCARGWIIHVIPEILFFYRQHQFSMRLDAYQNHDIKIKQYMYIKHKALYTDYYDEMVNYFLNAIDLEKRNAIKIRSKIDFRIGSTILKPLRMLKAMFK